MSIPDDRKDHLWDAVLKGANKVTQGRPSQELIIPVQSPAEAQYVVGLVSELPWSTTIRENEVSILAWMRENPSPYVTTRGG